MSLAARYQELTPEREPFLRRAEVCAQITVSSVCTPRGHSSQSIMSTAPTSFGARAAINLASKVALALLPPGDSSFLLTVPVKSLMEAGVLSPPPDLVKNLAQCEQLINAKIESLRWRRPTFLTVLHLVVAGNMLEYILPDGRIKQYPLDQYVCVRDFEGIVQEVVTCESMKARQLTRELKAHAADKKDHEEVRLYTRWVRVDDKSYTVQQDLDEVTIKPEETVNETFPVNALAWDLMPRESYGRSHVEYNYPDLAYVNSLSGNVKEIGALAAKHFMMVRPNAAGGNLRKRIAEARNGDVLSGNHEDVEVKQFQVGQALTGLREEIATIKRDLAQAFLMTGDLRRDAERVTAYELRMIVTEIESALGGNYSLLSAELQAWRLRKLISQMRGRSELPDFPEGSLDINVTTGLEALGRDEKLNRVRSYLELLQSANAFSEEVKLYVKFDEVLTPGAIALGFPQSIRSDAEVQQRREEEAQAQTMQQMATAAAGPLATAAVQQ